MSTTVYNFQFTMFPSTVIMLSGSLRCTNPGVGSLFRCCEVPSWHLPSELPGPAQVYDSAVHPTLSLALCPYGVPTISSIPWVLTSSNPFVRSITCILFNWGPRVSLVWFSHCGDLDARTTHFNQSLKSLERTPKRPVSDLGKRSTMPEENFQSNDAGRVTMCSLSRQGVHTENLRILL